jgi:hypothetical protein
LARIDAGIDYERGRVAMKVAELPALAQYTVRWTGTLTPAETGDYAIGLDARVGKLWLDGKEIVRLGSGDQSAKTVVMHLEAGHSYAVKIERGFEPRMSIHFVWARQVPDALKRADCGHQEGRCGRRRGRHHAPARRRGDEGRCARLRRRRPHQSRSAQSRKKTCSRPRARRPRNR